MTNTKHVRIDCDDRLPTMDFEKMEPLQGALKSLSQEDFDKLKNSVLDEGFFVPVFLWNNGKSTKLLDGHQRCRVLSELKKEGYTIPKVPYVMIKCKTLKQAKKRLLLITSAFGKIQRQGLYEFLEDLDKVLMSTHVALPEFNIDTEKFFEEFYLDKEPEEAKVGAQEISSTRFETFTTQCPKCSFEFDAKRDDDK